MKVYYLSLLFIPILAEAKINILLSYFDAFNRAPFNNSEKIAQSLEQKFIKNDGIKLTLCPLPTIYDEAYLRLEDCLKGQDQIPDLVISLGEGGCDLKLETSLKNLDYSFGPDNIGQERFNSPIITEGSLQLPLKYPAMLMYCALKNGDRKNIEISNSAGSFVCNNTAYKMRHYYPDINYGFIHVPAHDCFMLQHKTQRATEQLENMILSLAKKDLTKTSILPILKKEIQYQIEQKTGCEKDFFEELGKKVNSFLPNNQTN